MLADCLEKFDQYLWRTRDSDGDGCLESFCVYDTGEDNALRYGHRLSTARPIRRPKMRTLCRWRRWT